MDNNQELKNAQFIISNLAKGINPLTGEIIENNDIINNVNISRCLFFVSDILNDVQNNQTKVKRVKKNDFYFNKQIMSKVLITNKKISLTEICRNIANAYNNEVKITYSMVSELLTKDGVLIQNPNPSDGPKLIASEKGIHNGIYTELVDYPRGPRLATIYSMDGQRYVLDLLEKNFN